MDWITTIKLAAEVGVLIIIAGSYIFSANRKDQWMMDTLTKNTEDHNDTLDTISESIQDNAKLLEILITDIRAIKDSQETNHNE